jgi:hypothetical protein
VARGQSVYTALSNVQEQFYQEAGVIQPISTVPVIPSKYNVEADIQGEVATLWYPKSNNQQQVGIIKDDSGTIKFTVWTRSAILTSFSLQNTAKPTVTSPTTVAVGFPH